MELKITEFFNRISPMDFSASCAEIGQTAGQDTWSAACEEAGDTILLDTDEKRDAFRSFVSDSGGWADEEISAWSDSELNALCIQWIAGDMREPVGFELNAKTTDAQWEEYQTQCEDGMCAGRIFRGIDGEIYFYIGN